MAGVRCFLIYTNTWHAQCTIPSVAPSSSSVSVYDCGNVRMCMCLASTRTCVCVYARALSLSLSLSLSSFLSLSISLSHSRILSSFLSHLSLSLSRSLTLSLSLARSLSPTPQSVRRMCPLFVWTVGQCKYSCLSPNTLHFTPPTLVHPSTRTPETPDF
jgi:hypothetical protein